MPRFSERARPFWWKAGETYLLQRETFDHERGRMNIEQIYVAPETGVLETKRLSCRMYAYRELVALLQSCGFEDVRGLDAGDEPFRARRSIFSSSAGAGAAHNPRTCPPFI